MKPKLLSSEPVTCPFFTTESAELDRIFDRKIIEFNY